MRKYLILILVPFLMAAAPSRVATYTTLTTISSTDVTANEDTIFLYLQSGIDTYKDGTIVDADIKDSAAIDDTKLDLATIAQAVRLNGAVTFASSATFAGQTIADLGTVTTAIISGGTIDGVTLGGISQVTISDADFNDGTVDGVTIGGANSHGDIFYNDASDDVAVLDSGAGDSGDFLRSNGVAAPSWEGLDWELVTNTTITAADPTGNIAISSNEYYFVIVDLELSLDATVDMRFNNNDSDAADYNWVYDSYDAAGAATVTDTSDSEISFGPNVNASSRLWIRMYINTHPDTDPDPDFQAYVHGHVMYEEAAAAGWGMSQFIAIFDDDNGAAASSFNFDVDAGTMTGRILLYKIND